MPQMCSLSDFLSHPGLMLDVRSPAEFAQGHILGSHSFPLFDDLERAQIGTAYKKHSRQEAVELGLHLLQPKLNTFIQLASQLPTSIAKVLCWRGGMRSGFVGRLLGLLGYAPYVLQGGYKSYRRWVLKYLESSSTFSSCQFCVIGGLTGSGKTEILHSLNQMGEQTIDLESIANHRGSAFGGIGLELQPTQEQFENHLAHCIKKLDFSKPIWIEDEGQLIGQRHLPTPFYDKIIRAPVFYITRTHENRLKQLIKQYGSAETNVLIEATKRIAKRLGSQLTKDIILLFEKRELERAFDKLLLYYDKTYLYQLSKRECIYTIHEEAFTPHEWALALQTYYKRQFL